MKTKLWNLAVEWAEQEDEYPATLILGYSLRYLFLWAAPMSALKDDKTNE